MSVCPTPPHMSTGSASCVSVSCLSSLPLLSGRRLCFGKMSPQQRPPMGFSHLLPEAGTLQGFCTKLCNVAKPWGLRGHHAVVDGVSLRVLSSEVGTLVSLVSSASTSSPGAMLLPHKATTFVLGSLGRGPEIKAVFPLLWLCLPWGFGITGQHCWME